MNTVSMQAIVEAITALRLAEQAIGNKNAAPELIGHAKAQCFIAAKSLESAIGRGQVEIKEAA
jgi:hypothetical protein